MSALGDSVKLKLEAYQLALKGFCFEAIEGAVMDVLQGTAGIDERFCPTPPQLATICRRHQDKLATMLDKHQNRQAQLTSRGDIGPSEAARARMAAKADALVKELAATTAMDKAGVARPASTLFEQPKLSEEEFAGVLQRGLARLKREPV